MGFVNSSFSILIEGSLFAIDDCANFPFVLDQPASVCPANSPDWTLIKNELFESAPEVFWEPVTFIITPS